jgi:hypothetical protein
MSRPPGRGPLPVGGLGTVSNSAIQRPLLAYGVVGPVLFVITFLIEGVTRPGYDGLRQPSSSLESVATALLMVICLGLFGATLDHHGDAGVVERLAVFVRSLWTVLFVGRLLTETR